jgi:hypothetical protein
MGAGMSRTTAMLIAVYTVFRAKDAVSGCGKYTHVVCIGPDGVDFLDSDKIEQIEHLFTTTPIEAHLLWTIVSEQRWPIAREIAKIRSGIAKILSSR